MAAPSGLITVLFTTSLLFVENNAVPSDTIETDDFFCSLDGSSLMFRTCTFEIFGRVQGVYFRKHTVDEARRLQLVGTVRNTRQGSVHGVMQGSPTNIEVMKVWLRETGSPMSRIERAVFTDERDIPKLDYTSFEILR